MPNIPRTSDGKPNLAAPAPRAADGHIDLSGSWTGRPGVIGVPDEALTATSKALVREREENYFRDRPAFNCQPSGPRLRSEQASSGRNRSALETLGFV